MGDKKLQPELIAEIRAGETIQVEFKDDSKGFSDNLIVRAVVAMSNAEGGSIYLGVNNDGKIVGSTRVKNGYWKGEMAIQGMILENTTPNVATVASILSHEEKKLVRILVPKSDTTVGSSSGLYLRRRINSKGEPENLPMTPDEIVGGVSRIGTNDFSAKVLPNSSTEEIDMEVAKNLFSRLKNESTHPKDAILFGQEPRDVLKSIGLLDHENRPNVACLILFGKGSALQERLPNHFIQYQVFGEGGRLLKNERFSSSIAEIFSTLLEFPELNRNSDEFRFRGRAITIPEYPEDSRREAIANALVHRDYTLPSGVMIQIFGGQLLVINSGSFPPGVNDQNILTAPPTPRNRRLTEAMSRLRYVESSGRGVDFIFWGQAYYGRPAPDYSNSDRTKVCVALAGGKANLDFCKFILSAIEKPTVMQLLVLNHLFIRKNATVDEISALIQTPAKATDSILSGLEHLGLIQRTNDKQSKYFLKGSVHPAARRAVKPNRLSKDDMNKYRNQILDELKRRSPMSKVEMADMLGISPPQTYRLLANLVEEGIVHTKGKRWYLK